MKLKSLDIKGFKSFADKTQVILDNPITGVVGPNGCGKSNIVDAIRWVIGEHKIKSLRSDNLQDLIFNGSKSRSASGMAEVSLTFENTRNLLPTEFTTVTITRKFYRSGESEYRLNDVACRLKDIHNLFLDTGVSNDSYAIIELGMVDDIIKDKDGSRRRMLEQAAGISIYKTRKKEAKAKLDGTQQDLARIEDLLFEIGNNLRTLESQARKAERYLHIKNEYKEISVELAKASLEQFNDKYQDLNEQLEQEQDKKLKIETEISGDEAQIEANKVKLAHSEQELNVLQKQFNDLIARIRQLEGDKKLAAQRLDYLQEREKNLHNFLNNANAQSEQFKKNITHSETRIDTETKTLEQLKSSLDKMRTELDAHRSDYDAKKKILEEKKNNYQVAQRSLFEAEKKVAVADTSVLNIQKSLQQILNEKEERNKQISKLQNELEAAKNKLVEKQQELAQMIAKQEEIKANILSKQETLEAVRAKLIEENRILDAKKNEHGLLKSLVESLEGYPDSIKFLKKNKDWNNNAPLLSDVFVVQNEYKTALENVLDSYLNYYIVQNVSEAAQAINLLKNNKKGKANFIILEKIKNDKTNQQSDIPGLIPALSLVNTDEQYQPLANHLLHNVFISENENALEEEYPEHIVVVSKAGNLLKGKFTVGGGSVGMFEGNKIGRAKNLEKLASEIEKLTQTTNALQQEVKDTQLLITGFSQELNDKAIEQLRQQLNNLNNQTVNFANRIENYEQLNQNATIRIADLQNQLNETNSGISDTRSVLSQINDKIKSLQDDIKDAEQSFAATEQTYNSVSRHYNDGNIHYTRQQSKIETIKQELNFRQNQLRDLEKQVEENKNQLKEVAQQITETSGKLHFGDNELYELLQKKEKDEKNLSEKDRLFYEFRNSISEHESKISRQRREKEQAETLLNSIKEQLNDMKLQVAGMKERLSVEFKVNLDDILQEERKNDLSIEELNAETERLKKRLDNMGEINPTAIEAFNEIKVRHDFIVEQKTDLENARDTLLATIEEVENTANTKFKETFDQVRENFVKVFKALFTEDDNADLRLTDPENVADSGIEIYAQPKGKRPSTLTQLSGGEKTLTSTAFLFAIYLIKPAPFCILDEVDAPLDDANVGKFTQMIRKFSDNSQFIIVTHNKQTMAAVDVIYGVTMQEPGVSKLVPVDFRSLN